MFDASFVHTISCMGFGAAVVAAPAIGAVLKFKAEFDRGEASRAEAWESVASARANAADLKARAEEYLSRAGIAATAALTANRKLGEAEGQITTLRAQLKLAEGVATKLQDAARRRSEATAKGNRTKAANRRAANGNEQTADNDRESVAA